MSAIGLVFLPYNEGVFNLPVKSQFSMLEKRTRIPIRDTPSLSSLKKHPFRLSVAGMYSQENSNGILVKTDGFS